MDYSTLHNQTVAELRKLAREMGIKLAAGVKKEVIIQTILMTEAEREKQAAPAPVQAEPAARPARGRPRKSATPGEGAEKKASDAAAPKAKSAGDRPEKPARRKQAGGAEAEQTPAAETPAREKPAKAPARKAAAKAPATEMPGKKAPDKAPDQLPEKAPEKAAAQTPAPRAGGEAKAEAVAAPKAPEAGSPRGPEDAEAPAKAPEPAEVQQESAAAPGNDAPRAEAPRFRPALRQPRPFQRPQEQGEFRPATRNAGYPGGAGYAGSGSGANGSAGNGSAGNAGAGNGSAGIGGVNGRRPATPARAPQPRFRPYENASAQPVRPAGPRPEGEAVPRANPAPEVRQEGEYRRPSAYTPEYGQTNPAVPEMLAAGDCPDGAGVLEIHPDGYGFLRAENYSTGTRDVYVSIAQIRRFGLKNGDYVVGKTRPQREGDRYNAMIYITEVNGRSPETIARRKPFDSLVPIYPDQRLRLEGKGGRADMALRLIDMLAPIGKGQRGMIVSPPKAGKTTLLKKIANAITDNYPEVRVIVLLIDERPEEVTDMQRSIRGEVVYSTFDEAPENHTHISEMVLERAQRLVEQGEDVCVLMDSITRLARAYNITIPPTGRSLSGGLDPGALLKPKRFFGAARNIENGGSLTIIATALVETGSRMDDIIYEEFKGTGNMELHLDRKLSDRRIFPAIDMVRSGTRRDDLLMDEAEIVGSNHVRRLLAANSGNQNVAEQLIGMLEKTSDNTEFYRLLKGLKGVYEKDGYSMGGAKSE